MILIIYCHPYEQSFNHAELKAIKENLSAGQREYEIIDLYAEHFNPVYSTEELQLYHRGETTDPLVTKYLKLCQQADTVIFITPYWWNSIPGMLKGFVDKVMKEGLGLSHTVTKTGVKGELTNVKHCYVFTTSTSPTWYIRFFLGNAIKKVFINKTLRQLGFRNISWNNFGGISNSSLYRRRKYLAKLTKQPFK
ncbi:NAD(P)H-dependent oxidoreductase [Lactobacillus sp. ESL0230]|uniref:NAD(P)H-dependent oxidoreductase n=1 Tax=Lactobacillus sp. ESL0230 TaxID=2069353 RepID=UPI000EFB1112|nr:NAD(P)H-dependent oxidoreductase [Lactobacillus sp. ESL0230]RMC46082.1 flavodoxin family protein [Lactobacillus sp. ESL0230]